MCRLKRLLIFSVAVALILSCVPVFAENNGIWTKEEIQNQLTLKEQQIEVLKVVLTTVTEQYGEDSKEVEEVEEQLETLDKNLERLRMELNNIEEKEKGNSQEQIVLEGYLALNDLEGGFYEVDGYRLSGAFSFGDYGGKLLRVTGREDTSPSIYMNKGILVSSIEELDPKEYIKSIMDMVDRSINEAEKVEKNIPNYIIQYGESSSEINLYKEDMRTLFMDSVNMLEKLIEIDRSNADMDKYAKLGKALSRLGDSISIYVDGKKPLFEPEVSPMIEEGRTLVPFRAVAECIGAEVSWDGDLRKVTVKKDDRLVELVIGDKTAHVNGNAVELDVPAKILYGRTVLPLRFVSESLDATVQWVPDGKVIVISGNKKDTV
jgi:hypothetical protein